MTDDLEDLKRRLVVGHKSDGRSVYAAAAKAELGSGACSPAPRCRAWHANAKSMRSAPACSASAGG